MKRKSAALAAAILACGAGAASVRAQPFTERQMNYIAGPLEGSTDKSGGDGAQAKMQYIYHYFRPDRDKSVVKAPAWVEQLLPKMLATPAWQDPNEGVLNEANLWQAPVSVLYEFFDIVKRTFPPPYGQGLPPPALGKDFADNRTRFRMSLDRLYRARQGDAMDGRGRAVLSSLDLIEKEYDSLMDSIVRTDGQQFVVTTLAIAEFAHGIYDQMWKAPRGGKIDNREEGVGILPLLMGVGGIFMMFLSGLQLGTGNQEYIGKRLDEYWVSSQQWAQEFNRQFVAVKVHYLVLIPWGILTLLGLLTFNIFILLFMSGLGLYMGLKTPMFVLNFIRQRRGAQVERQLMDALTLLGNALKSGLDLVQGFQLVQKELLPPISDEFGLVIKNFQLGMPFERALEGMEDRIESRLLAYMVKAIVIQRQVGGNLIKIFDRIVENIREEAKLEEKIQSLTAQQKIQSIVVGIMPWVMLGVMFLFQGETMGKFYTSPIGLATLIFCGTWIGIGMKVVSAMGKIKV